MSFYSLLKDAERKKALSITEKETKISEMKKVLKTREDLIAKLTAEKTKLGDQCSSMKSKVSTLISSWCGFCQTELYMHPAPPLVLVDLG